MKHLLFSLFTLLCVAISAKADSAWENYGKGVELYREDRGAEAVPYLEKALGQGMTDAAYIIGECYTWGIGIPKNYAKAEKYYKIAANSKNKDAQYGAEAQFSLFILHEMKVSSFGEKEATEYLLGAANGGVADALYELGRYYKHHAKFGDAQKAMAEGAERGSVAAQCHLGIAWYEGDGIWTGDTKNYEKAFKYLSEAVESLEDAPIIDETKCATYLTIAKCYRFGRGVKVNESKANEYTRMAARYGDPKAVNVKRILNL